MRVIKLGGSLMGDELSLVRCLTTIEKKYKGNVVIVPGGGVYANLVRTTQQKWKFSDETAHEMAILAMKQLALLLKSMKPDFTVAESVASLQAKLMNKSPVIWSPDIQELNASLIKPSWDITSDSLAAWLAGKLSATELILIKSAEIPVALNSQQLQQNGLVDKAFKDFTKNIAYKITLINKHQFNEYNVI